jgi:biopolymer transport protein ExbD
MRRGRKADDPTEIVLPIPSFLDMAFQILAFFVMFYRPSALEGQMDLALPASGEARAQEESQVDPTKPPDTEVDLKSEVTVGIMTRHSGDRSSGDIDSLTVEGMDASTKTLRNVAELRSYLANLQKNLKNKDDIKIRADAALKYAYVVEVIDVCNKAGFKHVGFAPPPDVGGISR